MKTIICLKEVPSREAQYRPNAQESWIEESELGFEINECDEYALEEALKLKEQQGGEVTILTLGRDRAEKSMRKALAMGADRGILIRDQGKQGRAPHAVAAALAEVLKAEEYDLVLTGTQSDDHSYIQTGVILAELLGLPYATIVMKIEADRQQGKIKALREMESGWFQWVEMPLPALLSIQAGISQVRYVSLKGIMLARTKEIRKVELSDLNIDWDSIPDLEILRIYFPDSGKKAEMLEGDPEKMAATLVQKLRKEARVL